MSNKCNVVCEWMATKRIIVGPDGQVVPCCFFQNPIFVAKQFGYPTTYVEPRDENGNYPKEYQMVNYPLVATEAMADSLIRSYIAQEDELNAFNYPIDEIMTHQWFTDLYESWDDSDKVSHICLKHCSKERTPLSKQEKLQNNG